MEANTIRSRGSNTSSTTQTNPTPLPPVQSAKPEQPRYGPVMEFIRLVLLVIFWTFCTLTIHATQYIGSPLYFVDQDYYYAWMAFTKQQYGIFVTVLTQWFAPTPVIVSGDASVQGQYWQTADGRLETKFPERLVLIANHQLYTDWLYLWWIAYTSNMHGHIFIVLKDVFKYVPVVGWGMMFFGFIFMSRKWATDQSRMAHRLKQLTTSHSGPMSGSAGLDPEWLLIYPEGTNMSANTRKKSAAWAEKAGLVDLKHQVLPRSTGLHFALSELKGTVEHVYDVTVGYGGIPPGKYGQDIFGLRSTYIAGRPPSSVNFYFRRFAVKDIPIGDTKAFEAWILKVWQEKDDLLEHWKTNGRFPASPSSKDGKYAGGWIEAEVKPTKWTEVLKILVVPATALLVVGIFIRLWNFVSHGKLCLFC